MILANWFDEPARLDTQRRLMRDSFGVDWEPLAPAELAAQLKTSRYHGGLFERNAFHFHPLKYVLGVADAAAAGGRADSRALAGRALAARRRAASSCTRRRARSTRATS